MVGAAGSNQTAKVTTTKLAFDASTGELDATEFNTISDIRKKENVATIENALDKTLALRGVSFQFIDSKQKSIGVIAQEIESIIPDAVKTSADGFKSVAYGNIVGLLIEAIKELQREIEALNTQLK